MWNSTDINKHHMASTNMATTSQNVVLVRGNEKVDGHHLPVALQLVKTNINPLDLSHMIIEITLQNTEHLGYHMRGQPH